LQREYGTIVGQEDFAAYLSGLRPRYKIDINKSALESGPSGKSGAHTLVLSARS
jgi:hypothetical protein